MNSSTKWFRKTNPQDIQPIPWLGEKVIHRLSEIIKKDFTIIEHGSGGSTLWFAERCSFIFSVENNKDWFNEVSKRMPMNSKLIFNQKEGVPTEWHEYGSFDLMLIDGEPVEDRARWILEAPMIVKSNGYVVLDNANRKEYTDERSYLHSVSTSVETIDCNDGTSYLVTDICRLK